MSELHKCPGWKKNSATVRTAANAESWDCKNKARVQRSSSECVSAALNLITCIPVRTVSFRSDAQRVLLLVQALRGRVGMREVSRKVKKRM